MTTFTIVAIWALISLATSLLIGKFIRTGAGDRR